VGSAAGKSWHKDAAAVQASATSQFSASLCGYPLAGSPAFFLVQAQEMHRIVPPVLSAPHAKTVPKDRSSRLISLRKSGAELLFRL
jgi:hypothetical protein